MHPIITRGTTPGHRRSGLSPNPEGIHLWRASVRLGSGRPPSAGSDQIDDRADADAGGEVGEGVVDVVERAAGGHEGIEVELTGAPHGDHARDVTQRVAAPEEAAHELLLADAEEDERVELELALERGRADEDRRAAGPGRLHTERGEGGDAGALERVVGPNAREVTGGGEHVVG